MANLVITTECNGICPFCFAQDYVQKPVQRMDAAMVERLTKFCAGLSDENARPAGFRAVMLRKMADDGRWLKANREIPDKG